MNTREIFDKQIADNLIYTVDIISELVRCGMLVEGSDEHQQHLGHVGERVLYALVYYPTKVVNDTTEQESNRTVTLTVERYFESNFEAIVQKLELTHDHSGYVGADASVPRFTPKRK